MSRLLIITARYHPFIGPRAHRWTSLAEHWAAMGHEVHVVCARRRDCPDRALVNSVHVHRTGFDSLQALGYYLGRTAGGRGRVGAAPKPPGWPGRLASWLYEGVWKKLYFPDDAVLWYFLAKKKVFQLLDQQAFDAVISVSLPFTGHLIGLSAKRRFPGLRWLADIGDPFTIQAKPLNNAWLYGRLSRHLEQKVLTAAGVKVVTTGFAKKKYAQVFGSSATTNMIVIPPLLHPAPDFSTHPHDFITSSLHLFIHLGYFGAFYAPVRTPDAFLDLLDRTFARQPDLRDRLQVHFYGEIFPEFLGKLMGHPTIQLHGLRPRDEVRTAIDRMDILLNIGNTTEYQLPSKAAEYLATGKPVVNLSYVRDDPFIAFWGKAPGLLNLTVENGRVGEAGLSQWIAWLEGKRPAAQSPSERSEYIRPLLVDAVAGAYAAALKLGD